VRIKIRSPEEEAPFDGEKRDGLPAHGDQTAQVGYGGRRGDRSPMIGVINMIGPTLIKAKFRTEVKIFVKTDCRETGRELEATPFMIIIMVISEAPP
jgi:hypothetical protein